MQVRASQRPTPTMKDIIAQHRPDLAPFEELYRHLHQNPELSGQEEQTAATAAEHLRTLGFEVHTHLGGHGVAGVLRNGPGPTVLLRADMDALPVEEKTQLPYASTRTTKDPSGTLRPVMHACGHDTHVVSLLASAALLHRARAEWSGTVVCIFQPAEEQLDGARAMLADGLYEKVPRPEVVLAQHVMRMRTGSVSVRAGRFLTAADAFDVRIYGRGGHGSAPHTCIDPIVAGAAVVTKLQSIVSREVTPGEMAVVTCGCIQAGHAHNIIPDYCDLKLNVRTYDAATRKRVVESIRRIVEAECAAAGCVEKPDVKLIYSTPATINDGTLVEALKGSFGEYFQENLVESEPAAASEDFSLLATAVGAPYVMWTFGGVDAKVWDEAVEKDTVRELPSNHSPFFAPVIEPTLQTAVDAMAVAAMTFLQRKEKK
ncbi:putative zinc metallopeptidase [Aspergillus saccharolyticus JOP 1030-1]|uniref:Peptidase family M20/M25/M40 protein n=1 Tax=Aspergillus saccharolyticus JOP 1030-1 TaxID=1450539 RepID=A0A319ASP0_9EURO|nr:peptidase family M20/M25/M40 protein [Aspergillus saccharolyticus JOP 1030-1]PYH49272.1 peptidase family M20/M25/M40 protein [Aspergillus saccharolyticus JOP 1030-1]